jgi:hypothetical protein
MAKPAPFSPTDAFRLHPSDATRHELAIARAIHAYRVPVPEAPPSPLPLPWTARRAKPGTLSAYFARRREGTAGDVAQATGMTEAQAAKALADAKRAGKLCSHVHRATGITIYSRMETAE